MTQRGPRSLGYSLCELFDGAHAQVRVRTWAMYLDRDPAHADLGEAQQDGGQRHDQRRDHLDPAEDWDLGTYPA